MPKESNGTGVIAVSFIIDTDPIFAYMGWHLARSLQACGNIPRENIHIQFPPEVSEWTTDIFAEAGYPVHRLTRFGDGKYCNKLSQWENLRSVQADHFLFLDTDMICIADPVPMLPPGVIAGKVVDLGNPEIALLDHLFERAGFADRPKIVPVEAGELSTYRGNCNGGLYWVPAAHAEQLFGSWRRRALELGEDIEPLRQAGKLNHIDQISFCMAIHETGLPFSELPSNLNYYLHFAGEHRFHDAAHPMSILHYHNSSLDVVGLLKPDGAIEPHEIEAVEAANAQVRSGFSNKLFWDLRYRHFPERGSGVGSREENLQYKRNLLLEQGVDSASSVLDVGCGDLEVVRTLNLKGYVGIDRAPESLALARAARPDWRFIQVPSNHVEPRDIVLCFEVTIHQETAQEYFDLISFLAERTDRSLIISGYDDDYEHITQNHMIFFYEPLKQSLAATGRFRSITEIGRHSDVVIYRCDAHEPAILDAY